MYFFFLGGEGGAGSEYRASSRGLEKDDNLELLPLSHLGTSRVRDKRLGFHGLRNPNLKSQTPNTKT